MNRIMLAGLLADMAGDAAGLADRHDIFAFVFVAAVDYFRSLIRDQLYDASRAGFYALATGFAGFLVY